MKNMPDNTLSGWTGPGDGGVNTAATGLTGSSDEDEAVEVPVTEVVADEEEVAEVEDDA